MVRYIDFSSIDILSYYWLEILLADNSSVNCSEPGATNTRGGLFNGVGYLLRANLVIKRKIYCNTLLYCSP